MRGTCMHLAIAALTIIPVSTQSVTKNARCGSGFGTTCQGSQWGYCCSVYSFCGSTDAYCGNGCQTGFGTCGNQVNTVKKPVSNNSRCGGAFGASPKGQTCVGSRWGSCCSQYSYCGVSDAHCGTGCQSEFGSCKKDEISSSVRGSSSIRISTSTEVSSLTSTPISSRFSSSTKLSPSSISLSSSTVLGPISLSMSTLPTLSFSTRPESPTTPLSSFNAPSPTSGSLSISSTSPQAIILATTSSSIAPILPASSSTLIASTGSPSSASTTIPVSPSFSSLASALSLATSLSSMSYELLSSSASSSAVSSTLPSVPSSTPEPSLSQSPTPSPVSKCTPTPSNYITNGGFETGSLSPWTGGIGTYGASLRIGPDPKAPSQPNALFGDFASAIDRSFVVEISQTVIIPSGTTISCGVWFKNNFPTDYIIVRILIDGNMCLVGEGTSSEYQKSEGQMVLVGDTHAVNVRFAGGAQPSRTGFGVDSFFIVGTAGPGISAMVC